MLRMLRKDRVLLRNVVIAMVGGTLGAMVIGTACLGRDRGAPDTTVTSSADLDQAGTTQTTSAEVPNQTSNQANAGGVEPAATTNISTTTVIVNPAQPAAEGPAPSSAPVIIQQAAPASAPPADTSQQNQSTQQQQPTESNAAPASTVSPESVQAQDQLDRQREQESYQAAQGQVVIPVPLPQEQGALPGSPGNPGTTTIPGPGASVTPPSNFYPNGTPSTLRQPPLAPGIVNPSGTIPPTSAPLVRRR